MTHQHVRKFPFFLTLRTTPVHLQRERTIFLGFVVWSHPWSSMRHEILMTIQSQTGEYKCIYAVYMYTDITVLPNKQRTSNLVQIENTSRQPTQPCVTGPTGQDGLGNRLDRERLKPRSKVETWSITTDRSKSNEMYVFLKTVIMTNIFNWWCNMAIA